MEPRNIFPIPEAIDGRRWSVADGRPQVDLLKRALYAPVGDTDADRHSRAHEMAHVRITPKQSAGVAAAKHGVTLTALQACEDARVHLFLERRRIPRAGCCTQEECDAIAARTGYKPRDLASYMVAAFGTGDYDRFLGSLYRAADAQGKPRSKVDEFAAVVGVVIDAVRRGPDRRGLKHPAETARGFTTRTVPAAKLFDELFPERESEAAAAAREMVIAGAAYGGGGRWGNLKPLERAPLPLARRPDRRGVRRRFTDEGAIPVSVHRITTDGRIFHRPKRRQPGGTVLVDFSGSMSLDSVRLREIMEAAPAARVAVYSGRGSSGRIVVVADRGRCANDEGLARARYGGGNVVDGPALRWLAGQSAPRIWVSDGLVTGVDDRPASNLHAEAAAACRAASIVRVPDAAAAALAMAK